MGDSCLFCSLLAGRWCRSLRRHSDHLIVQHQWEHSTNCARSSSKVPNAPMGKLLTRLPQLTLAQLRPTLRSTTVGTCRRDLGNFPSPPWETHVLLVACGLQGGGVFFQDGTVTITSSSIYGNTAPEVRVLMFKSSQCPNGKIADVLDPTHA